MTIVVDVTPDEEARLQEEADRQGLTVPGYLRSLAGFRADPGIKAPQEAQTPDDGYWDGFVGVVDSGGRFNFSQDTGKAFAKSLLKKHHMPHTVGEDSH